MIENNKRMKIWETAALMALCAALCMGTWAQGKQTSISSRLVRLHVVAVSDDRTEQEIKLRVRDAVLEYLEPVLSGVDGQADAKSIIESHLEGISEAARSASEGRAVTVSLSRENYPTKEYAGFALPAGEYDSLRVILGDGEGQNWWCVVFPPLCLTAADAQQLKSVMGMENYSIVCEDEGYVLRFKLVELWGQLCGLIDIN